MSQRVEFYSSELGEWSEPEQYDVTSEAIITYAKATNDPLPKHRSGEVGSPLFAVVPIFGTLAQAGFMIAPPDVAVRVLHGQHDMRLHRPIRPGDSLSVAVKPIGYKGAENGTAAAFLLETQAAAKELVNEQYITLFFPKFDAGETVGELAPEHRFDEALRAAEPAATVTAHVDDDQTFRYAEASADENPIHVDDEVAKAAKLPGIIVHGLCTQAFTSWAALTALADGKTERLKRIAVRFAKPVLPGQDVSTTFWKAATCDGVTSYAFESKVGDVVVIQDGLVEIAN
jgi:acyl dehydratase